MKLVALHEAKAKLSEYVAQSQRDRVLITSHGKPVAIVIGVEGESLEDLLTRADPRFWEMIERVRARNGLPVEQIEAILAAQATRAARLAAADDVIDNSGSLAALDRRVAELHTRYSALGGRR